MKYQADITGDYGDMFFLDIPVGVFSDKEAAESWARGFSWIEIKRDEAGAAYFRVWHRLRKRNRRSMKVYGGFSIGELNKERGHTFIDMQSDLTLSGVTLEDIYDKYGGISFGVLCYGSTEVEDDK